MISSRKNLIFGLAATAALTVPLVAATTTRDPLAEAQAALDRGDGIAAEIAAKQAIASGLAPERASAVIGHAEMLQEDYRDARHWLEDIGFSRDTAQRGFHLLGLLEMEEDNLPEAGRAFDRALALGQPTPELWVDIGKLRYRGGEHLQARDAADHAMEIGGDNARAIEFRGMIARDAEGLLAALPWFERGLEAHPEDLGLLREYAATLGEIGRAKEMLLVTRRMVELDPANPHAFFLQAVLAARAGKFDLARRLIWRAGETYEELPAGIMLHGVLELQAGNARLASARFAELVRRQPDNPRARMLFARALLADDEAREVVAQFETAATREDAPPYIATLVGRAYEQLGERGEAARFLDKAAAPQLAGLSVLDVTEAGQLALYRWGRDPEQLEAMIAAIRESLSQGDLAAAQALVERLKQRYRGSLDVAVVAGDVALAAGDAGKALYYYRDASLVRLNFPLAMRMAQAHRANGAPALGLAVLVDYLRQHPRSGEAAGALARLMAERGAWAQAGMLADYALALGHGTYDPGFLSLLAAAELERGNGDRAEALARRAYQLQRANGRVAAVLARVIDAAGGNNAESAALLAKSRAISGTAAEPQFAGRESPGE